LAFCALSLRADFKNSNLPYSWQLHARNDAFLSLLWLFMPLLSTTFTKKADNTALKRDKNKDK